MKNFFSGNLFHLLKTSRMSQTDLANRLGIKPQAVNRYLSGKNFPSLEVLLGICDIFGVTLDQLIRTDLTENNFAAAEPKPEYKNAENIDKLIDALDKFTKELKKTRP